jgi:transposase
MSGLGLTAYQRRRLRRQLRAATDARLLRRVLALLEIDRGQAVGDVARLVGVSPQSVYNWIGRFQPQGDPAALADRYGVGRPTLWTEDRVTLLRSLLASAPERCGYFAVDWTVPLLQEQLARHTGQRFAEDTVRRELHRLGYVWKRSRYVLAPDPELEKKTADPPHRPPSAAPERPPGRGRD